MGGAALVVEDGALGDRLRHVRQIIFLIVLPFMLMWPFWLAAKWFGVPWTLLIERDGKEVGRERMRGWRASGQRVAELARQAEAGTLMHLLPLTESQ